MTIYLASSMIASYTLKTSLLHFHIKVLLFDEDSKYNRLINIFLNLSQFSFKNDAENIEILAVDLEKFYCTYRVLYTWMNF